MPLQGSIIAVVTPMKTTGDIDYESFAQLLTWQIQQGCDGIVICGSTGEAATLSTEEKMTLFEVALSTVGSQVPLIAATGTNNTAASISLTRQAFQLGYQYSLLTCPYYNKPMQHGLYLHYQAIAESVPDMKHILYSIPGRSMIRIENETVIQLAKIPNIVGIKDSGSTKERIRLLRAACGPEFSLLSGDDDFTLDCLKNGGDGVISVSANAVPLLVQSLVKTYLEGNVEEAERIDHTLTKFTQLLFCETNPIPLKALLHHMGKIQKAIRLPLTWLSEPLQAPLFEAFEKLG